MRRITFTAISLTFLLLLAGCDKIQQHISGHTDAASNARVTATPTEIKGVYELKLKGGGVERLELKEGGSYLRNTVVDSKHKLSNGIWTSDSPLLGHTEITLTNPDGDIKLEVVNRAGKVALERADMPKHYYERMD